MENLPGRPRASLGEAVGVQVHVAVSFSPTATGELTLRTAGAQRLALQGGTGQGRRLRRAEGVEG